MPCFFVYRLPSAATFSSKIVAQIQEQLSIPHQPIPLHITGTTQMPLTWLLLFHVSLVHATTSMICTINPRQQHLIDFVNSTVVFQIRLLCSIHFNALLSLLVSSPFFALPNIQPSLRHSIYRRYICATHRLE